MKGRIELLALIALAGLLFLALDEIPVIGDPEAPPSIHVSPRYIERGPGETGAKNMVTAVLADYRGYDTFGELVVIFTAGLACLLILDAVPRNDGEIE